MINIRINILNTLFFHWADHLDDGTCWKLHFFTLGLWGCWGLGRGRFDVNRLFILEIGVFVLRCKAVVFSGAVNSGLICFLFAHCHHCLVSEFLSLDHILLIGWLGSTSLPSRESLVSEPQESLQKTIGCVTFDNLTYGPCDVREACKRWQKYTELRSALRYNIWQDPIFISEI